MKKWTVAIGKYKVFKNKKELCYNFAAKLRNKFQNINIEIYKKEKNDK